MKFLLIASLFLVAAYAQQVTFTGGWVVNQTDFNCKNLCCCPLDNINVVPNPANSSTVLVTADRWSDNTICSELGRKAGSTATYPFPANIDMQRTPLANVYNSQGEGFAATFFNVTRWVVVRTLGSYFVIDDSNIGDHDGGVCQVVLVKKVI